MGSFRVIELQLVAFIVVFSASGLVPLADILFPLVISLYCVIISVVVFPRYQNAELSVFQGNRLFQLYVIIGTVIGLFLPLSYVLGGFARNDQQSVRSATPHLFLLSCQVLSENLVSGYEIFSLPVRAFMPILYTTRRLFALVDWTEEMFIKRHLPSNPTPSVSAHSFTISFFNLLFKHMVEDTMSDPSLKRAPWKSLGNIQNQVLFRSMFVHSKYGFLMQSF